MLKFNQLDRPQFYRLAKLCEGRVEEWKTLSKKDVARAASTILGFEVTVHNLQGVEKATGLQIGRSVGRPGGPRGINAYHVLRDELSTLMNKLGYEPSEAFKTLLK